MQATTDNRLFNIDAVGLPLFLCDSSGVVQGCNDAFTEQFGPAVGAFWQSLFAQVQPVNSAITVHASRLDAQYFVARSDERDDQSVNLTRYRITLTRHSKQGLWHGVVLDVTREWEFRAETEAVLATAVDPIIVIDAQGRIESANTATTALFGFSNSELLGEPITLLMPEPDRSQHQQYINHYLNTGEEHIIGTGRELNARHKNGSIIPIHLAVSEIRTNGIRRFAGILRDLSAQRAALASLDEQRNRLTHVGRLTVMGEMTASIAHEINQPLTAISMYAQSCVNLIDSGSPDLLRLREALEKLSRQSLRAGDVIERIQRFTRAEDQIRQPVDLAELIRDLVKLAESDARLNEMRLRLDLESSLPTIQCDPIQIQQVLLNLVRNAIDVMAEVRKLHGDEIVVSARRVDPGSVEIAVVDQGTGVSPAVAEHLFTPFHTTKAHGMGMGLSICRSIIADHEGTLHYRNHSEHGATFFFRLPVNAL